MIRIIRGGVEIVVKASTEKGRCGSGRVGGGSVGNDEKFSGNIVEKDKGEWFKSEATKGGGKEE